MVPARYVVPMLTGIAMYKAEGRPQPRALEAAAARRPRWLPEPRRIPWLTLGLIAVGGVAGALTRQALWAAFPQRAPFDWTTLFINVTGRGLIGMLMAALAQFRHAPRLTSSFLGTGVLGGFTTFSTYIVEIQRSIASGRPATGLAYLIITLIGALLAARAGMAVARLFSRLRSPAVARLFSRLRRPEVMMRNGAAAEPPDEPLRADNADPVRR